MSQVQQFASGQTILISGFTGFLGKLLLTKLLTSCPDVDKIYVFLRKASYPSIETRLNETLKSKVSGKPMMSIMDQGPGFSYNLLPYCLIDKQVYGTH